MSCRELKLEDSFGRKIHVSKFAGQIVVTPTLLNDGHGDSIALSHEQAHWLLLYLQEHLKRGSYSPRFDPPECMREDVESGRIQEWKLK